MASGVPADTCLSQTLNHGASAKLRCASRGAPHFPSLGPPEHGTDIERGQVGYVIRVQVAEEHLKQVAELLLSTSHLKFSAKAGSRHQAILESAVHSCCWTKACQRAACLRERALRDAGRK